MSEAELKQRIAKVYLDAYKNYTDSQAQMEALAEHQRDIHKVLCDAAGLFLGLDESEMSRILFYWDSIATDARVVLGVEE